MVYNEQILRQLADKACIVGNRMIKDKKRKDIVEFLTLSKILQTHGYKLTYQIIDNGACIIVHRNDEVHRAQPTS